MTKDNHLLGQFDLTGIPAAPRGVPQIEVAFKVDADGIMHVSAEDKGTGSIEQITIKNDKGRLSQEEIEQMIREAEEFSEQDKETRERIDAKNQFENYIYQMKNTLSETDKIGDKLDEDDIETAKAAVEKAKEWLESNPEATKEELDENKKEMEDVITPIISKLYKAGYKPNQPEEEEGEDADYGHDEL